jgi:hypothetical protein
MGLEELTAFVPHDRISAAHFAGSGNGFGLNVWGVAEIAVRAGSGTPGPLVALSIALNPLTKIVTTDLRRDVRQGLSEHEDRAADCRRGLAGGFWPYRGTHRRGSLAALREGDKPIHG